MAGIIAASTDNSFGIAGIGYSGVNIMPVTVMNAEGIGQDSDIIAGVIWATDNGADVILMGFSNPGFSQNLQEAIDYAWSKGVVLVAATGNDGQNVPTFPAGDRGVIGVSATDQNDALTLFSNYGQAAFLAAPGIDIDTTDIGNSYVAASGTSTSAAIVAGVAGLMRAVDHSLSNGLIVGRLARTADPAGTQEQTGNGRVNMARALADSSTDEIQPAGAAPVGDGGPYVGPYVIAGNNTVNATVNSGGSPLSGATVACTANCTGSGNSGTTDASGTTIFPVNFIGNSATITLTASKTGYSSESISVDISKIVSPSVTFNLTPTCTAPTITGQPSGATKTVGESVTFSVTATGTAPLSYQWRKGGVNIGGATSSSYTINLVVVSDTGSYDVVVTNSCGSVTSSAATLTVNKANATCTVTPYSVTYDGNAHTAAGSCIGVKGESLSGLDLSGTTHTNAGDYPSDPWSFAGGTNYNDASGTVHDIIDKATTKTTVSSSPTPSVYSKGLEVTFTATVSVVSPGSGTPTGTVTFKDGTISLGTGTLNGSGVATFKTSSLSVGIHLITAVYGGDSNFSGSSDTTQDYIVIYDPTGGFVTGGGWITSPKGAYYPGTSNELTGKANFGFVSKYQKGASVPTGETEFQFKVANLNFHSEIYDWLVVAGARAQYKGTGTINGTGNYGFMLTAIDGQINGGGGLDKFRIKIWDLSSSVVVYDNQIGDTADTADPTTAISGGSIVIHK